ncbi:unnamed protein product [Linum trigynum]|uniref:Reverse transcriptase zinc-binding domain-containing protein n=1 Tax=Linum trigynum TaxID=586398 RepID=A0AAV2E6I7_9ROSI
MLVYSVRRVLETLRKKAPEVSWHKLVWSNICPPRYSLIVWLLKKNVIIMRDKLLQWGKVMDASCPLCGLDVETRDHMFLRCSLSLRLASLLNCHFLRHNDWDAMLQFVSIALCRNSQARKWHALV